MKLTKQQLKQIIKEELEAALSEGGLDMSKLHKPTSLPGKTKKSRPTDDSKKDLDMSKLHKPTSLPGKSEEDDSEELQEKSKVDTALDAVGEAGSAQTIASAALDNIKNLGKGAGQLAKKLPYIGHAANIANVASTLRDPDKSTGRRAAELASTVAGLNPVVGVGQAAYDITQGITGQEGSPLDIDLKTAGSDAWGALTGRDPEDAHTGGTQVDLSTRTDASCKRRGPKGKCLDAPSSTTPKVTPPPTTPKPSDLVAKRDDDEDDIPKPGKNLAEAWGFSMDLDKLNESTSGHVTPAKD